MSNPTLKDKDRQQYYDTMESLFGHPGWALLMEDANRLFALYSNIENIDEAHSVEYRRGEIGNLRWLLSQQAVHDACYADELAQAGEAGE